MTWIGFTIWAHLNLAVDFMISAVLMIWGRFDDLGQIEELVYWERQGRFDDLS